MVVPIKNQKEIYDDYLNNHKANVTQGFNWLLDNLPSVLTPDKNNDIRHLCEFAHDSSKTSPEEYDAYAEYFYGNNRSYAVLKAFDEAWLHHIHHNPHHWQHWVLMEDDPKTGTTGGRALEMPYHYVVEMICDWWSFSWKEENLGGIFDWYDEHKATMLLHPKTRKTVEDILAKIKAKLIEGGKLDGTKA